MMLILASIAVPLKQSRQSTEVSPLRVRTTYEAKLHNAAVQEDSKNSSSRRDAFAT